MSEEIGLTDSEAVGRALSAPAPESVTNQRPKITFLGNNLDITALGAFASGLLVLLTCLTCGQVFYCLPIVPLVLGIIGLVGAKRSVDAERTRLWSWLGIGGGGITLLLVAVGIASYFAFIVLMIILSQGHY